MFLKLYAKFCSLESKYNSYLNNNSRLLQGYFNNNSKPSTEIRPPDKQMYNDKQKLLENIKDENIFRKHLPKQAELDKYMEKL